jgi:spermidine synthase
MLGTFLAGLAVGSWVWGGLLRWVRRPVLLLAMMEVAIGIVGLLSISYFLTIQKWFFAWGEAWAWRQPALALMTMTALALFLPVTLMGGALPVASAIVSQGKKGLATSVGTLYAVNTIGAVAGAFVPAFFLIATVGTQWAVLITGALNVVAGGALLAAAPAFRRAVRQAHGPEPRRGTQGGLSPSKAGVSRGERITLGLAAVGLTAVAFAAVPANSLRTIFERTLPDASPTLLYYRDGVTGTVTIHQTVPMGKVLSINGLTEVPTDRASLGTFRVMGHVPMLLHPRPRRVLSITFGGGIVAGAMAQHEPEVLDVVDVCAGVFDAARLFAKENQHVLDYPSLRIFVNDARNFIAHSQDSYDVIISDCTHPKSGDSWVLFTREFYRDVRQRLNPDGVFAQFILIHRLTYPEFRVLLGTLAETFPHSTVWAAGPYVLVVATVQPFAIDYERVRQGLGEAKVAASLAAVGIGEATSLLANFCLDPEAVKDLTQGLPINTEDRPFVGLSHLWLAETTPVTLRHIFVRAVPATTVLTNLPTDPAQAEPTRRSLRAFYLSHPLSVWAEYALGQRRLSQAISQAQVALSVNEGDTDAQYVLSAAQSDLDSFERVARQRLASSPRELSGHLMLARALVERGKPAEAVAILEQALSSVPASSALYEQLGNLYLGQGEAVGAARLFRQALDLEPRSAAVRVSLARALLAQGRTDEAEQLLKEALARDRKHVGGHETLGVLFLGRGEVEKAEGEFQAMLASDPFLASPYVHLGSCYETRRLYPQALANYRLAVEQDPYFLAGYLSAIRILAVQGDRQGARQWALHGLQFLPTASDLVSVLGDLALEEGNLEEAERSYSRALALDAQSVAAYAGLAEVATARGDVARARHYWQEVLSREPGNRVAQQELRRLPEAPPSGNTRALPPG